MKNKSEDLRNHLFATLEALHDKDNPMEISRAKAIADVAQVIVNNAKVEVEFARALGRDAEQLPFFGGARLPAPAPAPAQASTVHRLK